MALLPVLEHSCAQNCHDLQGYSPAVEACHSFCLRIWSERTWDSCGADVLAAKAPLVLFPKTSFPEMRIFLGIYKEIYLLPLANILLSILVIRITKFSLPVHWLLPCQPFSFPLLVHFPIDFRNNLRCRLWFTKSFQLWAVVSLPKTVFVHYSNWKKAWAFLPIVPRMEIWLFSLHVTFPWCS